MKSKTSDWFETKVRFDKVQEDGTQKKVTEQYVVEALSFTEAEAKIISVAKDYTSGEFAVKNITPARYHEIFFSENHSHSNSGKDRFLTRLLLKSGFAIELEHAHRQAIFVDAIQKQIRQSHQHRQIRFSICEKAATIAHKKTIN